MNTFKKSDIALVTGGGSGIGRATCQLLAEQGATVIVTDINQEAAEETLRSLRGKNHMSLKLDVAQKDEVESVIRKIKDKYASPPTIAVNSAAIVFYESLLDLTEEKYSKLFDINVKGTIWVTQAVCRELKSVQKTGSIVNISSICQEGLPKECAYSATKGAVQSFSHSVAVEFGPHGIRTNVVSPAGVDTPFLDVCTKEEKQAYVQTTPFKRFARLQEVAEVIVFLASEKASYVNGATYPVYGGLR